MEKRYIEEQTLLEDSYRLAVQIYQSGYRPDFIVGLWRGGSTVGIYVQECLQYLGIETDHIAIRTSYRGMDDYLQKLALGSEMRAHGLQYLFENMNAEDNLLIVDDVYSTGRNVDAVISRLKSKTRRNMSRDVRVAAPYYRSGLKHGNYQPPDYFLREYSEWLVLPYELTGLTDEEIAINKGWIKPILDDLKASQSQ
ncbi:MAG: hypoxanthine phosphoribosyltransferase [Gammaproteobacteria bacterium]|nr:hypoxanthine phosphoribosyltransferase [Gammaproteobacteria bacterium]